MRAFLALLLLLGGSVSALLLGAARGRLGVQMALASSLYSTLDVDLGDRSYPIYIGNGLLHTGNEPCTHSLSHSLYHLLAH